MKKVLWIIGGLILLVAIAGFIKFNFINDDIYVPDKNGNYVNNEGKKAKFIEDTNTDETIKQDKIKNTLKKVTNNKDRNEDLCDENGNRYSDETEATKAGLTEAEFGATYCPEYKMDPSWDKNKDKINDCYEDNSCSADLDYMVERK